MIYGRGFVENGTYFFTVVTFKRRHILCDPVHVGFMRDAFRSVKREYPFDIQAFVLLPDHFHCMVSLPPRDSDFSTRLRRVKSQFSRKYRSRLREDAGTENPRDESPVWQGRCCERMIRNENAFQLHTDYIHFNPVKHGLAEKSSQWKYSSFRYFIKYGIECVDWGKNMEFNQNSLGWDPDKI